jgi:hypothetical protein
VDYTLQLLLIKLSITVEIIINKMCHTAHVKIDNSFSRRIILYVNGKYPSTCGLFRKVVSTGAAADDDDDDKVFV